MNQQLELQPKRFWTSPEMTILRQHYPVDGPAKVKELLPHRTLGSIYQHAIKAQLRAPKSHVTRHTWESTPQVDAEIRVTYQSKPKKDDIRKLAARLGYPRWWVSKRATHLGLVVPRFSEPAWTSDEVEILTEHSTKHPNIIRQHLKKAGFARTETAIVVRRKRLKLETKDPDYFTTGDLSILMGVDRGTVDRWIDHEGLLATKGIPRKVSRKNLRNWISTHAQCIDLRKVDRFWFIDLAFSK